MRCSKCGSDSPAGKKFCGDCGAALVNNCPKCGAENPSGKHFCGDCGAELALTPEKALDSGLPTIAISSELRPSAAPDSERKNVTALFADIKGSMELMEQLDPEDARPSSILLYN
jgi:hypothetical protein